jgi:hypothetical protein
MAEMKSVSDEIKDLDTKVRDVEVNSMKCFFGFLITA